MTRNEFNSRFACNINNTEGYTELQIDEINDAVFTLVADADLDAHTTDSHVKNMFGRVFAAY